ncbi:MAG TPA: hypothetical protein VIR32_10105, partial [Lachnospiraceae bacterium]
MRKNSQFSYIIRIMAGAYLLYLAIPMLKKALMGEGGDSRLAFIGFSLLFIVAALYFIISSIRGFLKDIKEVGQDVEQEEKESVVEEKAEKEE